MVLALDFRIRFGKRGYTSPKRAYQSWAMHLGNGWEDAFDQVKEDLRKHILQVAEDIAAANSNPWPGGTTATTVSSRSGEGVAEIRRATYVEGNSFNTLKAGFRLTGYMVLHELGGTKKAGGKLLTIPLPAALDGQGRPLKPQARDWPNTFVGRSKAGNLLIFQRRGTGIIPLYVLKQSVTIPARLGIRSTLQSTLPRFLSRATDDIVREMSK